MRKILFLSRDPGSTNAMISVIPRLKEKFDVIVFGIGNAKKQYANHGIECHNLEDEITEITLVTLGNLIEKYGAEYVMTGQSSSDDLAEMVLWEAARKKGVVSLTIVDSWCDYDNRFPYMDGEKSMGVRYTPDYIFVMDEVSKREIVGLGLDANKIIVSGQPYLQYVYDVYCDIDKEDLVKYRDDANIGIRKIILFASDAISETYKDERELCWGYDQKSIFEEVVKAINKTCPNPDDYIVIAKPHPKEQLVWEEYVKSLDTNVRILVDRNSRSEVLIKASDLVIGMWSIILVEAVIADVSVMSVQIGSLRKAPFVLEERKLLEPIYSSDMLENTMNEYFSGVKIGKLHWDLGKNAIDAIVRFVIHIAYSEEEK